MNSIATIHERNHPVWDVHDRLLVCWRHNLQGTRFPLAHMDVKSANVLLRGNPYTNLGISSLTLAIYVPLLHCPPTKQASVAKPALHLLFFCRFRCPSLREAAGAANGDSAGSTMPPVAKIGDVGLAQLQNTVDGITMSGTMPRNAQLSGMLRSVRGAAAPAPHVSGVVSMNMSCVSNANNMASTLR